MTQKIFNEAEFMVGYPTKTRAFYAKIVYLMTLNIMAYKKGYFATLLCDTDDVYTFTRFVDMIPDIQLWMSLDDDMRWSAE